MGEQAGCQRFDADARRILAAQALRAFAYGFGAVLLLYAIAHGFAILHGTNDHEKIRLETPLYDALYAWCQREASPA